MCEGGSLIHEPEVVEGGQSYRCVSGAFIYGGIVDRKKEDQGQSQEVLHEIQGELICPAAPAVIM